MRSALNRSMRLSAALFILASGNIHPAHAAAAAIANGETKTGTVTGSGSDSYTISVPAGGGSFVLSAGESGNHTEGFLPRIDITAPGASEGPGSAHPLAASFVQISAAEGNWTVKVSRADGGQDGGGYALKLIQIPGATGTALTPGANSSGTITRGGMDVWTFSGAAGHTETLSLAVTGGEGFVPEALVFSPAGDLAGGCGGWASCARDVPLNATGTYTVVVRKTDGGDVTGSYTLSVNAKN